MDDLLNITLGEEFPISGRELHERLGVATPYRKWFPRMCDYGFEQFKDFQQADNFVRLHPGGSPATDHHLTLDMAKELCMLQRTDQGRAVRRYLISIEASWNNPEVILSRALLIANDRLKKLSSEHGLSFQTASPLLPPAEVPETLAESELTHLRETAITMQISEKKMLDFLERNKVIQRSKFGEWIPADRGLKLGLVFRRSRLGNRSNKQTYLTAKGRAYINRFKDNLYR
jgi:anti-repressor protein